MLNHDFATVVHAHRRRQNLLQREVAQRAQISERTLRDWEKGKASPGRWELESLLTALELNAHERLQVLALLPNQRGVELTQQASQESQREEVGPLPVLGDLLRAMRLRRRMAQEQLAETLKVAPSTVFRWETTRAFPSEENIERLCKVLGAFPEEREALQRRRFDSWSEPRRMSLEECAAEVERFGWRINFHHHDLLDLQALALKRHLWLLANDSEAAVRLLACTQVYHAVWLEHQSRYEEANDSVQRSLKLLPGREAGERFWQSAFSMGAKFAVWKEDPAAGVDHLMHWVRTVPRDRQTTVWSDMAKHAAYAGQMHEAKAYLEKARETLPYNLEAERMAASYLPIAESKILCRFGRPVEALERLPPLLGAKNSPTVRAQRLLLWAETLFQAGERDEAQRRLEELQGVMIGYPMPLIEQRAERLIAAFEERHRAPQME